MTQGETFLITQLLAHGYGAEDISVMMDIQTANVRAEIERLRAAGEIDALYKKTPRERGLDVFP